VFRENAEALWNRDVNSDRPKAATPVDSEQVRSGPAASTTPLDSQLPADTSTQPFMTMTGVCTEFGVRAAKHFRVPGESDTGSMKRTKVAQAFPGCWQQDAVPVRRWR
jgi:hypothetical protein